MAETFSQRLARSIRAGITPDEVLGQAIVVKEYKSRGSYERGVRDMGERGYIVVSAIEHSQRPGLMRILLLNFFALLWRPKPHFVVTYQRR